MNSNSDFVHLHAHSEYSQLDGMPSVGEYIMRVHELGMPGIALTEHGNMRSMVQLAIKAKGEFDWKGSKQHLDPVKPIFGIEFYVAPIDYKIKGIEETVKQSLKKKSKNASEYKEKMKELENKMQVRKRYHVLAFAKNDIGMKNLLILNYMSWKDGYYYRPRIDINLLKKYHEGIIITTSCIGGWVPSLLLENKLNEAEQWLIEMKRIFKDDLYLELQPHKIKEQEIVNAFMIKLADEHKIKLVATNDCHYLLKEDSKAHEVLLAVQSKKPLQSADAWRFDDNAFYLKTKQEMIESFKLNHPFISPKLIKNSLETTMEIFEKCNVEIEINKKQGILPDFKIPVNYTGEKNYLINLCKKGWIWRNIEKRAGEYAKSRNMSELEGVKIYRERLEFELKRIFKLKFEKYFLIIHELISWARKNDIMVGPGRGSSSASIVCYLLGITSIDPIEYDLLFDRFLNAHRMDYPDVDMDFEDMRRKEVFKHLFERYGEEHVSLIGTNGTMKGKQALHDVSRVLGIPHSEVNQITKHIIERSSGDARSSETVADSFNEFDVCKDFNKRHPEVLPFVEKLEGKVRNVGVHACGIQIAPMDISTHIPIEYREIKGAEEKELWGADRVKVSALDWRDSQDMGLIKMDVLGLRTLTILKSALKEIEKRKKIKINLEEINLEDDNVLDAFTKGMMTGIFQFDSVGMKKTCEKLKFTKFEDIISLNALYRPGAMRSGLAQHYINRKIGKEKIEKIHPIYDNITKDTYGILVYQEQLLRCFVELAGYHPDEADSIRKAVAKSFGNEYINREKEVFIKGAGEKGLDSKKAEKLFENISFFGSYAFNKAHAAAYGMIAYWCQYLKIYYPTEFFYALMRYEPDNDKILHYVSEARKIGIDVKMPDINYSDVNFNIEDDNIIRSGLIDIKGCGRKASEDIINNQPYSNMLDFLGKINRRVVNRGTIKALVKAGAFRSIYPNMGAMIKEVQVNKNKKTGELISKTIWELMIDSKNPDDLYNQYDIESNKLNEEQEVRVLAEVCPIPPYKHKIEYYDKLDKYIFTDRKNIDSYIYLDEPYDHDTEFSNDGLKRTRGIFKGILVDIKYNNVGDFDKEEPDEEQKKRKGWGKRYSMINIEDTHSIKRVNVDINTFPTFRKIIDKGINTPVFVIGSVLKWQDIIAADIIIDLDEFRDIMNKKISLSEKYKIMNPYQRYLLKHPCSFITDEQKKGTMCLYDFSNRLPAGLKSVIALVTRAKQHWTKKDKEMMFLELEDDSGYLSTVVWEETIQQYREYLKPGNVIRLSILKKDGQTQVDGSKPIRLVKKYWNLVGSTDGSKYN
jgi:DNA polymerase-3 subunit alpha